MRFGCPIPRLSGYAPAVPTPFSQDGSIDLPALERFCDRLIREHATALVVCGTTGEAPTLSPAEDDAVIRTAVAAADGRVPVIAGAGSNSTSHAIDLARQAEAAGADAILAVVPYYNRPTQAGLLAHFRALADATALPLILYDVPSRTACKLADDTIARLAEHPRCIGLKDASGDIARPARLRALAGPDFRLLSGDDATALGFIANGGHGCISVTANVATGLCRSMYLAWKHGQTGHAQRLALALARLNETLFAETNPAPLKYALSLMGSMSPAVRLPLVEASDACRAAIAAVLEDLSDHYPNDLIAKLKDRPSGRSRSDPDRAAQLAARPAIAI